MNSGECPRAHSHVQLLISDYFSGSEDINTRSSFPPREFLHVLLQSRGGRAAASQRPRGSFRATLRWSCRDDVDQRRLRDEASSWGHREEPPLTGWAPASQRGVIAPCLLAASHHVLSSDLTSLLPVTRARS
ncbi:hypothetical protein CesoFtcFv8_025135 [Champsocephalus esox]|uniref:Uncharacterized protein n=1 Tax=Champsocephalus esox TaxID=159716 RepID=A0AAN8B461_9TELE|nr:hypothetical protein CesoFtcFv8_025135 [Champsocephalus esox]